MTSALARVNRRVVALIAGVLVGAALAAGAASAITVDAHTTYLWYHGMNTTSAPRYDGHPFLDSTDGAHRDAIAAWRHCPSGIHSDESRYISQHVHINTDIWYRYLEAHLTSGQTGMGHHIHFPC